MFNNLSNSFFKALRKRALIKALEIIIESLIDFKESLKLSTVDTSKNQIFENDNFKTKHF